MDLADTVLTTELPARTDRQSISGVEDKQSSSSFQMDMRTGYAAASVFLHLYKERITALTVDGIYVGDTQLLIDANELGKYLRG